MAFQWLREWYEIRAEERERQFRLREEQNANKLVCSSCEILKVELENAHREKSELLRKLLEKDTPNPVTTAPKMETLPRPQKHLSWAVKQQMLEAEDRAKAVALKNAAQPISTEDLEKELETASIERENQSGAREGKTG